MISDYHEFLKKHNLSVTSVRLALLRALEKHPHSDAETIFNMVIGYITSTSKQSIYNNLHTLVEHGLVREIKPKGQPSLFETRVGDNHHHLVCRECNLVMDVDCHGEAPCLEPIHNKGFLVDEAEVTFWGICPTCQLSISKNGDIDE